MNQQGACFGTVSPGQALEEALASRLASQVSKFRAGIRLLLIVLLALMAAPVFLLAHGYRLLVLQWLWRSLLWLANIRVSLYVARPSSSSLSSLVLTGDKGACAVPVRRLAGKPKLRMLLWSPYPLFLVGNHVSFLDIAVLGSCANVGFVAAIRAGWNRWLERILELGHTVLIQRRWHSVSEQVETIRREMQGFSRCGRRWYPRLVIFGEGTTSNGAQVLPFFSGLFESMFSDTGDDQQKPNKQALDGADVHPNPARDKGRHPRVRPFAIYYRSFGGVPLTPDMRDVFSWYGAMPFWPHFLRMLGLSGCLEVDVVLMPLLDPQKMHRRESMQSGKAMPSRRSRLSHMVRSRVCWGYEILRSRAMMPETWRKRDAWRSGALVP